MNTENQINGYWLCTYSIKEACNIIKVLCEEVSLEAEETKGLLSENRREILLRKYEQDEQ